MSVLEVISLVVGAVVIAAIGCWIAVEFAVRHVRRRQLHHGPGRPGGA